MNTEKDTAVFLSHILESCTVIQEKTQAVSEEQFYKSRDLQDILIRRIEIIGEAVKHLPKEFTDQNQEIPWKKIAGMRDMLIHHYFDVDYNLLWTTVTQIIPSFRKQIQQLLKIVTKQ